MTKQNQKIRTKEKDAADRIVKGRFWRAFGPKFNKAHDRQILVYELTRDNTVFHDSFWTTDEKRLFEIWRQFKAILDHLFDIQTTIQYLKFKGLKAFLKKNGLAEIEYLRFIYENYQIRISSTPDIIAKLGDIIYRTGISERKLNWYRFITHGKVKNLKCSRLICELESKINHLRQERHKLIHFGGHKSQIIESIESNTFDKKFLKNSPFLTAHYKRERASELKRLERDMKTTYRLCVRYTKMILDSMAKEINLLKVGHNARPANKMYVPLRGEV